MGWRLAGADTDWVAHTGDKSANDIGTKKKILEGIGGRNLAARLETGLPSVAVPDERKFRRMNSWHYEAEPAAHPPKRLSPVPFQWHQCRNLQES
jgi:hypothetical protein